MSESYFVENIYRFKPYRCSLIEFSSMVKRGQVANRFNLAWFHVISPFSESEVDIFPIINLVIAYVAQKTSTLVN